MPLVDNTFGGAGQRLVGGRPVVGFIGLGDGFVGADRGAPTFDPPGDETKPKKAATVVEVAAFS